MIVIPCQASLQPQEVQEVFKRKQFTMSALCLGESILWYCYLTYYLRQRGKTGKERVDLLLYQACIGKVKFSIELENLLSTFWLQNPLM